MLEMSTSVKRGLTLVEVYAEMSHSWKRIHLHKILILVFQFLSQIFELLPSELPIAPLSRLPVISCHRGRLPRILTVGGELLFAGTGPDILR